MLVFALLSSAGAWIRAKDKKIERQGVELAAAQDALREAQGDNERLLQDVKRVEAVLDSARTALRQAQGDRTQDSIFYAQQIEGLQNVLYQVRAKAKRERDADAELIVELRKGLPPKECYNVFGRRVDCKDK